MITVLVAGATAAARAGLAALLAGRATLRVAVAESLADLAEQVDRVRPDVVLLDVGAERGAGVLRELARTPHPPPTVAIADDPRAVLDGAALAAGVRGVLARGAGAQEIAAAIGAVASGLFALHPGVVEALPLRRAPAERAREAPSPLTAREVGVLGMIAEGLGNKVIASRLGISEHTVKFHIASIFAKLDAGSRTEAVTIGLRHGLIMI